PSNGLTDAGQNQIVRKIGKGTKKRPHAAGISDYLEKPGTSHSAHHRAAAASGSHHGTQPTSDPTGEQVRR
ncbi:hypothetical protein, partial [Paraburkholderia caledonica]|uniref:hypothetical protein n=1 Tax=Paraburkholderia caledonica TaxID=134536 RepID=UPI0037096E35